MRGGGGGNRKVHRRLDQSLIKNTPILQVRRTLMNPAKTHARPPWVMYRLSQSPFLWLPCRDSRLNDSSVQHGASVTATVTPWQSSQRGQGSDVCELDLFCRRVTVTNEKFLYRTIKYDQKNGMCLFRYFMDERYSTGKCHVFCSLCECSDNNRAISS
jgi:hypothetical protein